MSRTIRCQGAIVQNGCVLLIRYRDPKSDRAYWLIPGGGREGNEPEEECVRREMREETNLDVDVERILFEQDDPVGFIRRLRTYLCRVKSGAPSPGYEPGPPIPNGYGIVETGWFHLGQPETWGEEIHQDAITRSIVLEIRKALGYESSPSPSGREIADSDVGKEKRA